MDWFKIPVVALFKLFRYLTRTEIEILTEALQDQQFTRLAMSFFLHFPANVEGHPNPSVIIEQIKRRSEIHPTTLLLTVGPPKASTDAEPFRPTIMEARILELIMTIDNDYRNCFLPNRPEVPKSWTGKLVFFVPPRDRRKCEDLANKHYFELVKVKLDNGRTYPTEISARGHQQGLCISTSKVKLITDEFKLNYIRSMWTCSQENLHIFVQFRQKQVYSIYTMSLKVENPDLKLSFSVHSDAPKPRKTRSKKKCATHNGRC
ncbi:hypothetical protein TCAL_15903 [Tigriopus californicus]|uniref:Uncharacterized protein n=1 Tax=Tigriopus californicus TaxID=6832 RepID=A0A553PHE2_TIGCA|nr:uncharacterized protein LOC131880315 [Tigriopus californicus]TRY77096.1 hypothetical protein TCAL_15903 [Tigriopus californicus]